MSSGTWIRTNTKITRERTCCLDIKFLKQRGYLTPGASGVLRWSFRSANLGSVNFHTTKEYIHLTYTQHKAGQPQVNQEQRIQFRATPCQFGGERFWFSCPKCNKRVGILALCRSKFLCRHCAALSYASRNESEYQRLASKIGALKASMYDQTGRKKKKGMHWETFHAMSRELELLEYHAKSLFVKQYLSLFNLSSVMEDSEITP